MKNSIIPLLAGVLLSGLPLISTAQPVIMNCPQNIVSCSRNVSWNPPTISSSSSYTYNSTHSPGEAFPQGTTQVVYTFADATGTSTCSFNVTVNAPACNISLTPSAGPFTDGVPSNIYLGYGPQSVTIKESSGGSSYSWAPASGLSCTNCSDPVFSPSVSGNYTLTTTINYANGCNIQCSTSICVMDIRAGGNKIYICRPQGNSGKFQTQAMNDNAVPNQLGHGAKLGSCELVACNGSASKLANAYNQASDIMIYPNPFSNDFQVNLPDGRFENASIMIYDVAGRVVEKYNTQNLGLEFRIGKNLLPGLYFVEINNGSQVEKIKVSKL